MNAREIKDASGNIRDRAGERGNYFCTGTKDCDHVEQRVIRRRSLVPGPPSSACTIHQECPYHLSKGQEGALKRGIKRRRFSGESSNINIKSASVTSAYSRHHYEDTELSSSGQVPELPRLQTSGHQKSRPDHTTSSCAEVPEVTVCHVKRGEKRSPLPTWCTHGRDNKKGQPNLPQGSAWNSHFSQAPCSPLGRSEGRDGLHDPCDRCLFVHPYLLVPLLPPTSAFTNPCWPPTPSKKRRGLPDISRAYHAVPDGLSEAAADSKVCPFFDSLSGSQDHTLQSPCASARCSLRYFAERVASDSKSVSLCRRAHWVDHPCKACVNDEQGHQTSSVTNVIEPSRASRKREKKANERKSSHPAHQPHCHRLEKNRCLIGAGHLIQCACCSPWLPIPSLQLRKKNHVLGDGEAGRATSFTNCTDCVDTRSEATYTMTANLQSRGHSFIDNCHAKRRDTCYGGFRHEVNAVSSAAESGKKERVGDLLHETTLSISRQPPVCDFAGKGNIMAKSLSQTLSVCCGNVEQAHSATTLRSALKKPSSVDDWKGTPNTDSRDEFTDTEATVHSRVHESLEAFVPEELLEGKRDTFSQGTSLYNSKQSQEGERPCAYSQFFPKAQKVARESPGTKGKTCRAGVKLIESPQAAAHLQQPQPHRAKLCSPLVRALHNNSSASAGRRPALCALPACYDRSVSKSVGTNGSVLLPSIGCGLAVAQSSLGRGSGLGLYATKPFSARSRISEYSGLCVDRKVVMLLRSMGTSTHVMRVGMQHQYLVGYRLPFLYGGAGAFVNDGRWYADGRRGPGVGARFQVVYDKKRARDRVYVVATRNIAAGEEILTSYDNMYWALME